jgi:hypothetical protein
MIAAALEAYEEGAERQRKLARKRLRLSVPSGFRSQLSEDVVVHDISVDGLLLEARSELPVGETITVELPEAPAASAKVVWNSGNFHGCQFVEPISAAAVSASLLRSPAEPPTEAALVAAALLAARAEPFDPAIANSEAEDRLERGNLSTGARIQIVVAVSVALWVAILFATGIV